VAVVGGDVVDGLVVGGLVVGVERVVAVGLRLTVVDVVEEEVVDDGELVVLSGGAVVVVSTTEVDVDVATVLMRTGWSCTRVGTPATATPNPAATTMKGTTTQRWFTKAQPTGPGGHGGAPACRTMAA
jgi:hypothetical protein